MAAMAKTIHFVRHGFATHNLAMEESHARGEGPQDGYRAMRKAEFEDARLTPSGERQACALADLLSKGTVESTDGIQLVVTSPLTRCLRTAELGFAAWKVQ
jgi:broad specificity phosphatase PhoE